jgi:hypothetical protein
MAQMIDALKATVEAEKTKLLAELSQATEPRLGETSVVRERRELSKSPLRPGSLLRRPSSRGLQARSLRRASEE